MGAHIGSIFNFAERHIRTTYKKKGSSPFSGNFSRGSIKATILFPKQNNPTKPLSGHLNPVYQVVMATIQERYAKTRISSHK